MFIEDQDFEAEVSLSEENLSATAENPSSPTLRPRQSRRKFEGKLTVPQILDSGNQDEDKKITKKPYLSKNECYCNVKIPPKFLA